MSQTGFEHPTFCMRDESFTSYVIYFSLLNMDKIASLEESHNQGDVNPKNMTVLQQTRDVEEEPIAICHMRELKGAKKIFSAAAGAQIVRAAEGWVIEFRSPQT